MIQYDVAIGMNHQTLDQGFSQLYADTQARSKLFKGEQTGKQGELNYTATWDIQTAPTFILSPPPENLWMNSIDTDDKPANAADRPTQQAFQMVFPRFHAGYTLGSSEPVNGTTKVIVFAQIKLEGDALSVTPLSVWLDQSKMPIWDQLILRIILKEVLVKAQTMLSGIDIPPLSFSQAGAKIELSDPIIAIVDSLLVMAASLKPKTTVDIGDVQWPADQPLFSLMSQDVVKKIADPVAKKIQGQNFSDKGEQSKMKYEYSATVDSVGAVSTNASDMTKISTNVGFSFSATIKPLGLGGPCAVSAATKSM